ncbi:16S rRNA (uracil(1498)-N(3))-methyltransferase [Candidatus Magnetobacterium casense]|uniref:Ribosomal RNA small subunit methyltransferase E n=1 Tax=Candidatus Magnetobacterium casense TaxID=1455061 RepID=A0ABS6RZ71_9BACT|nr:16S rRNA (uracil(1498)-N(3))-methyltransferase [Candidatus Magnetobacterium casensis]MBV6341722.1 16S rRNA (uracil(1498)-N(3))-methyltransferase [Candidatus Magnetobacterium casensis]
MPNVFLHSSAIHDAAAVITGETSRYILSVLRYKTGGELSIFDEKGRFFKGIITSCAKNAVQLSLTPQTPPNTESPVSITLCQGLLKGSKMDIVVQKAVELGVKEIIPMVTSRTQLDYTRKIDRWRKIAIEAARQSMRVVVPEILETANFHALTQSIHSTGAAAMMFYEGGGKGLKYPLESEREEDNIYVITGPEGGFTPEEVKQAEASGVTIVTLGSRILRAETAAISALTLIQFIFGDMGRGPVDCGRAAPSDKEV